jgi:hypothetical protein
MNANVFVTVLAAASAVLAVWVYVRFPSTAPEDLGRAMVHAMIALAAGWVLVPPGMNAALQIGPPAGPLVAVFLFALPGLVYLFLTGLWVLRVLQEMLVGARR